MSDARQDPFLSIVIPAYNEEKRLPPTLHKVAEFLRAQPYRAEALIVENGSTDRTSAVVEAFAAEIGICPGIVVGRLQHDGTIGHDRLNGLRRRLESDGPKG